MCIGGSNVTIWSLKLSSSRCCSTNSVMSSPSGSAENTVSGPATLLHEENVSGSRKTASASSYPVTITTPWLGLIQTGLSRTRESRYG